MNLNPFKWFRAALAPKLSAVSGGALRPVMTTIHPEHMRALREVQQLADRLTRAYDASITDNYNSDFRGTYLSANGEMLGSRYKVRTRVRTLAKDTPHGKAVVRTFQDNVVGDEPFKLEMRCGTYNADGTFNEDKELNRQIESLWRRFGKKRNFTVRRTWSMMEALRMVEAELVGPGTVICRKYRDPALNEFGFALDFLEEDRLQAEFSGKDEYGNPIRGSISYHPRFNYPVFYHILSRHPGDVFPGNDYNLGGFRAFREMVPASDIILFSNLRDRAEQDLGFTELDAVTQPLWRIHQYEKSLTLSAIASAAKPWWIEKQMPTGTGLPSEFVDQVMNATGLPVDNAGAIQSGSGSDPAKSEQNVGIPAQAIRPGAREELPIGYQLKWADPKFPIEAAHDFRLDNLRDIAVGTGIAYQHASGDYQNLGFIAGLMCMIPFQNNVRCRQRNLIDFLEEIFEEFLKACVRKGLLDIPPARIPAIAACAHFKGKGFQHVNPLVQAQALIMLHEKGHLTRQQVQDALPSGMSVERLITELKNEHDDFAAAGIGYLDTPGGAGDVSTDVATVDDPADGNPPPSKKKPQLPRTERGQLSLARMLLIQDSNNGHH